MASTAAVEKMKREVSERMGTQALSKELRKRRITKCDLVVYAKNKGKHLKSSDTGAVMFRRIKKNEFAAPAVRRARRASPKPTVITRAKFRQKPAVTRKRLASFQRLLQRVEAPAVPAERRTSVPALREIRAVRAAPKPKATGPSRRKKTRPKGAARQR